MLPTNVACETHISKATAKVPASMETVVSASGALMLDFADWLTTARVVTMLVRFELPGAGVVVVVVIEDVVAATDVVPPVNRKRKKTSFALISHFYHYTQEVSFPDKFAILLP
jgi:hypothetical protein